MTDVLVLQNILSCLARTVVAKSFIRPGETRKQWESESMLITTLRNTDNS